MGIVRKKRKNSSRGRRLLLSCVLFFLSFNLVFSAFSGVARADANEKIKTFITLASGKQTSNVNLEDLNLSEKDLRFLGVYISNFFIPFGTELGTNEDVTSMNKEDIKKALQTNLSFSDAMATSLTETLIGLSRASVKELSLYVSKEYQGELVQVKDMPLNYYTVLCCMLGGLDKIVERYKDSDDEVLKGIKEGTYQYGYFAYSSGGSATPVFDFDIDLSSVTPSMVAFTKALESVDIESGYGFNFFDFTKNEAGSSQEDYSKLKDELTNEQIYKMSVYGMRLSVDCFGNLIIMGGNHQFVAIPGAMNPYTWVVVDDEGKTVGDGHGGTAYNMINIPSMALQDNTSDSNKLFTSVEGEDSEKKGVVESKVLAGKLDKVSSGAGKYALRKVRGSNDAGFDSGVLDWVGVGSNFRDLAKMAEEGYISANPKAMNYFGIKDGLFEIDTKNVYVYGKGIEGGQISADRKVSVLDKFVFTDNLGAAHFDDSGEEADFKAFNPYSYLGSDSKIEAIKKAMGEWGGSSDNGFTNTYKNIKNGDIVIPSNVSKEAMIGIYVTYAFSALYDESSAEAKKATIGALGYKMNVDKLPSIPDKSLSVSEGAMADVMLTSIRDWVYYLLHPTEGKNYFKTWLTTKINSFLVGWHDDMVGTNGTGSINGTTRYRGTSGYVTSPDLSDIPWVDSLIDFYRSSVPYLIVLMIIIMLSSYVVGVLSFQKAVIGFLIFCIACQMPVAFINGVVGTSNRFSSNLYGDKFTYWALVQHESYSSAIDEAANGESYSNYLKVLYNTNSEAMGNQGGESIMLKWQAPKKMSSLMLTKDDKDVLNGFASSKLLGGLINSTYSGETYLEDESVYLYRSYIDIANFSRYIHRGLSGSAPKQEVNLSLGGDIKGSWSASLREAISNYSAKYETDRSLGYANKNGDGSSDGINDSIIRVRLPLSSGIVSEAYSKAGTLKDMGLDDYVGINQDAFNFSIPMFNVDSLDYYDTLKTDNFNAEKYPASDFSGLAGYGLMSENPFYYFSWYLYESGLSADDGATEGYKNLLLGEDNAGFFYNTGGNGELKDFMDMRSLFTYIIPYLKQGNDIVDEWDKTYGIFIHEGVPTEEGHHNDSDIKGNPELQQKYWHNLNVARLYNIYTPWVDVMYDCSYAKPEKISYLGESYSVSDPINPASYPAERPMIFSRSEMVDYGLKENQLTKVERLILKAQEGMEERMFKLLNYFTFNDTVLNTAAAMNCAFEFNTVFSENSFFGSNHNIYPQSFELNDFSYDAFLRFILANSTGESMIVGEDGSFYGDIVAKSSTTTIIMMLVLDIISVYVMPALRIFFIVGMFIMSVLIILMVAFRVDEEYRFIRRASKSFVVPMFKFLGINCLMAYVLSLFMGEGNVGVTGSMGASISLGDPVMVMLIMVLLNCIVLYVQWKLLVGVFRDIRRSGRVVGGFVGGVLGSVGGVALAGALAGSGSSVGVGSGRGSGSDVSSSSVRARSRGSRGRSAGSGEGISRSDFGDISSYGKARGRYSDRSKIKRADDRFKKVSKRVESSSKVDSKVSAGLRKLSKDRS